MDSLNSRAGVFGRGLDSTDIFNQPTQQPRPPMDPTSLAASPTFAAQANPMGGSISPAPEYPKLAPPRGNRTPMDPMAGVAPVALGDIQSTYAQSLGLPEPTGPARQPMQPMAGMRPPGAPMNQDAGPYPGTNLASSSTTGSPTGDMGYLTPFFGIKSSTLTEGPVGSVNASKTVD